MTLPPHISPPTLSNALLVMAKRPAPGFTKTRLSPPLSLEQAAMLYDCFLKDTLDLIRTVPGVQPVIAYTPQAESAYFNRLAPDFELHPQQGPDLGCRLDNALTHYLRRGYQRVAVMDSDGPTLPPHYLEQAFEALEAADVVLGPCDDGGYYLIGLKQPAPRLLREVQMSTPSVTADTLALAEQLELQTALLPTWYDVDDARSLARMVNELENGNSSRAPHTHSLISTWAPKTWLPGE
jgi:rSAM/selenodomain-associated transferase 1